MSQKIKIEGFVYRIDPEFKCIYKYEEDVENGEVIPDTKRILFETSKRKGKMIEEGLNINLKDYAVKLVDFEKPEPIILSEDEIYELYDSLDGLVFEDKMTGEIFEAVDVDYGMYQMV